eukprot:SAG22_NODE_358_length_11759_cov_39.384563_1_plen_184_part_10
MAKHVGFGCDGCGKNPIIGCRYTKAGQNYDLCSKCFGKLDKDAEKAKFTAVEAPAGNAFRNAHWAVVGVVFALMVATKPRDLPGVPGDVPGAPVIGHLFEIRGDVAGADGWTAGRCAHDGTLSRAFVLGAWRAASLLTPLPARGLPPCSRSPPRIQKSKKSSGAPTSSVISSFLAPSFHDVAKS